MQFYLTGAAINVKRLVKAIKKEGEIKIGGMLAPEN